MRYNILILFMLSLGFQSLAQANAEPAEKKYTIFTDVSKVFIGLHNLGFERRFGTRMSGIIELRTANEWLQSLESPSEPGAEVRARRFQNGRRRTFASVDLRVYCDDSSAMHGFYGQVGLVVQIAERYSDDFLAHELVNSPGVETTSSFYGFNTLVGYRHVFENGLSLAAQGGVRHGFNFQRRNDPQLTPRQQRQGGYDLVADWSMLQVGYVW